jgi:signal transduction histidine kinase
LRTPARRSSRPPPRDPTTPISDDEIRIRLERLASLGGRAAEVAHELRNALSVLETSLHLARRAAKSAPDAAAKLEPHFARMAEQIHAGQAIVREALDTVRVSAIERRELDLRAFLMEVVASVPRGEGVEVEIDAPSARIAVDARQVRQLLLNLLRNAVEAIGESGRGRGLVRVAVRFEGDVLRIDIEDDGPGIDPAVAERLFQPFATSKAGGTGLGLAVCRRIAEAHGGSIHARPRAPRGTAMEVRLSLRSA